MKNNAPHLLLKLNALAARTPSDSDEIKEMLDYVMRILEHQFNAYLVDIMWEDKQAKDVELRALAMRESERRGYTSRRVFTSRETPDSLTGWCYVNNRGVWITDPHGLSKDKAYENRFEPRDGTVIPEGTIYEYNENRMRTEICVPLEVTMEERGWTRTAGVLNIESQEVIPPTTHARDVARLCANVVEQLCNRNLQLRPAKEWWKRELNELRALGASFEEPTVVLSAFVVRPFQETTVYDGVRQALRNRGIRELTIATTDQITSELWKCIRASHFGVVVSTGYNPNVLLEWGYLLGCKRPVIQLHQPATKDESAPFDVAGTMRYEYAQAGETPSAQEVCRQTEHGIDAIRGRQEFKGLFE